MTRTCTLLLMIGYLFLVPCVTQAAKVNPKFIKKVTLKWEDQPVVAGIVKEVEAVGLKITVDQAAMDAEALSEVQTSVELNSVPLYPALREIARLNNMYLTHNGKELQLTTRTKANEEFFEVTYSLQGIQGALTSETEFVDAVHLLGYNWSEIDGGDGTITVTPGSAVINQTAIGHDDVSEFLSLTELALRGGSPTYLDPRTQASLRKKFQFAPGESSLEEQLQSLLKGINYLVSRDSLTAEGIDLKAMAAPPTGSDTVAKQLDALCSNNKLGWSVHGGILVIQAQYAAEEDMELRVYNVTKHITPELTPDLMAAKLRNTEDLGPWAESGDGFSDCVPLGPLLIVWHHRAAHEKIAELVK